MGLLDRLINKGARAIGDAMADKLADTLQGDNEVGDAFRSMKSAVTEFAETTMNDVKQNMQYNSQNDTEGYSYVKEKSFEEKLQTILENAGNYEVRKNISPDELEMEYGQQIYARGGNFAAPELITYGIYKDGCLALYVRYWDVYREYNRAANRQIKQFCDGNGIKMLDFFDYLPNEEGYMDQRIREQLV